MGIKNLKKFIKSKAKSGLININPLIEYKDNKIAIDLSGYLYKFVYNMDNKSQNFHLKGFFEMAIEFLDHNITPIFIFDGKPNEIKNDTIDFRKKELSKKTDKISESILNLNKYLKLDENEISKYDIDEISVKIDIFLEKNPDLNNDELDFINNNIQEIYKNKKNIIKITPEIINDLKQLFSLLGVPFLQATSEADFLCAKLSQDNVIIAVCSEDMDLLAHGVNRLINGINSIEFKKKDYTEVYILDNILEELDITMDQFIDLCIISGCDYCGTLKNIGGAKGLPLIKKYKNIENFPNYKKDDILKLDEARLEFKNYNNEIYNIEDLNVRKICKDELIDFLLNKTTYKNNTILKKLEKLEK